MRREQTLVQQTARQRPMGEGISSWRSHVPRLNWLHSSVLIILHALSLLGLWFWPRQIDIALLVGFYLLTCFGITLGYHRLLTHRSYACSVGLRRALVWMGAAAMQRGPARWVAVHRRHHQMTDIEGDPHSPSSSGFLYAHMGWVACWNPLDEVDPRTVVPDVAGNDPWLRVLDRGILFMVPWVLTVFLCYAVAGWRGVLWGGIIRTVCLWHFTWCVNSVCHYWGSHPNKANDRSGNVWWVGLLTLGEGWHNNHHARPRVAFHGWRWYQIDLTGYVIRLMALLGLVWDVTPVPYLTARPQNETRRL